MKDVLRGVAGRAAMVAVLVVLLPAAGGAGARTNRPATARCVPTAGAAEACGRWQLDELALTLREGGFDPAEVTRSPGKLLLMVDNRSGVERITLRLAGEDGTHVRDIEVPSEATDWGEEVELAAGAYALTVVGRPEWVCRIVVQ